MRATSRHRSCTAGLLGALLLSTALSAAAGDERRLDVRLQDDVLEVHAERAPLSEVLQAIGKLAGAAVEIHGTSDREVSTSVAGLSVESTVRRLAGHALLIMVYDESDPTRLAEIRVYDYSGEGGGRTAASQRARGSVPVRGAAAPAAAGARAGTVPDDRIGSADTAERIRMLRETAAASDPQTAARVLGGALAEDPDPRVRASAVSTLRALGGETSVIALEKGLEDTDRTVRARVVSAIAQLGGQRSIAGLAAALFDDPDPEVRLIAVKGLQNSSDEAARALLEAAAHDADPVVQDAARGALGQD